MKRKNEVIDIIIKFLNYLNNLFNDKKVKFLNLIMSGNIKTKELFLFVKIMALQTRRLITQKTME